jgi:hypothetical protein
LPGDVGRRQYRCRVTDSWEQYLRESAVPRAVIDGFIERPHWTKFDPELGYTLHDSLVPWGESGSRTIETFRPSGARSRYLYADRKPRINGCCGWSRRPTARRT